MFGATGAIRTHTPITNWKSLCGLVMQESLEIKQHHLLEHLLLRLVADGTGVAVAALAGLHGPPSPTPSLLQQAKKLDWITSATIGALTRPQCL